MPRNKKDLPSEEKILKAAIAEFAQSGYHGARVESIAKRAKVNKAVIYYYFKSKEKLYKSIIALIFGTLFTTLKRHHESDKSPGDKILALSENIVMFISTQMDDEMKRLLMWEISSGGKYLYSIVLNDYIVPIVGMIREMYAEAKKSGEVRDDIDALYTHMLVVGSSIAMNVVYMIMSGHPGSELVFKGNFPDEFKNNLLNVLKKGIFTGASK